VCVHHEERGGHEGQGMENFVLFVSFVVRLSLLWAGGGGVFTTKSAKDTKGAPGVLNIERGAIHA